MRDIQVALDYALTPVGDLHGLMEGTGEARLHPPIPKYDALPNATPPKAPRRALHL
jgi:hypothetical protein